MRVLVIGGTGAFSIHVVERALARGHEVTVFARGERPLPKAVPAKVLRGDRAELRDHAAVFAALAPDVVVDSICFHADQAQDLVSLFADCRRVVLISSVDVFGEDVGGQPVTEERAPEPVTDYARGKLESELVVLEGLGPRATVFRPSHILGRGFLTASLWGRSDIVVDRIARGKPIAAIDGGCNLVTPVHCGDAAEWVVRSFEERGADGQVINAVGGEIITQRHYYECIAKALGAKLALHTVPSSLFRRYFDSPAQFNHHRPYSSHKAQRLLGYAPQSSPAQMLRETVESMKADGRVGDCESFPFDDELASLLQRHERELGELLSSRPEA